MSKEELSRLEVMQRLERREMNQRTAAEILGICPRQVKRLLHAYRQEGAAGLVSKQRGKPSHNQLEQEVEQKTIDLLKERYRDFGPTLAHEKLVEVNGVQIGLGSVRRIMIEEGLWKARKVHRLKEHPMRERRACIGELVQMDGADHDWFEGRSERCSLLVMIDDASGQVGAMTFVPEESFFGYCSLLRQYLDAHSRPVALYTDKHGIFRVNLPTLGSGDGLTQFGRAMKDLDIQILCANSPQAKGRVERLFETLQDRLPKELRLQGINDRNQGNTFLPEFLADFNRRFAVQPRSTLDAHRPLTADHDLDRIFTRQEIRTLSSNLTIQFDKVVYQIKTRSPGYALRNLPVTVCQDPEGKVTLLSKGRVLEYSIFHKQPRQAEETCSKQIDRALINQSKAHKPAPNHPWHTNLNNRKRPGWAVPRPGDSPASD